MYYSLKTQNDCIFCDCLNGVFNEFYFTLLNVF